MPINQAPFVIGPETISQVCHELTLQGSMALFFNHLDAHQPAVVNFVIASMGRNVPLDQEPSETNKQMGMKAVSLAWFSCRCFELKSNGKMSPFSKSNLMKHWTQNEGLIEAGNLSLSRFLEVMDLEFSNQAALYAFILETIKLDPSSNDSLTEEDILVRVDALLIVKSVIEALQEVADGISSSVD